MRVLLIEPNYVNKYPPLGLMKISTFHKSRGDSVSFFKGTSGEFHNKYGKNIMWDRIYVSTIFTFQHNLTLESINLAKKHAKKENIYVGGVGATLLANKYSKETNVEIVSGLLDKKNKLNIKGDERIDKEIPDYSILDEISYTYPTNNAYIGYATRGCKNKCKFCAVPILEPEYCDYIDLKKYVNAIEKKFGEKKNLLLLDNNVLASKKFEDIIKDIKYLGFEKDAKYSDDTKRYIDFNQGLEGKRLTEKKAKLLSEIAIKPARIAFDHIQLKDIYCNKIKLMAKYGVFHLSNYLLYNYTDKPQDLYKRIKINIQLNEKYDTKIFSFPMKFIPLHSTNRFYIGKHWTRKQIRAIQTILHATHGVVGPKREFVMKAFGQSLKDFERLLWMPELYIMYREKNEKYGAEEWRSQFENLTYQDKKIFKEIIKDNMINDANIKQKANSSVKKILKHYTLLQERRKKNLSQ